MEPTRSLPPIEPRRDTFDAPGLGQTITYRELTRSEFLTATEPAPEHTFVGADGQRYLTELGVSIRTADTVAAGCIDPETGAQLWAGRDVIGWPTRVWADAVELERRILELSEATPRHLKSGGAGADAGGAAGPG